MSEEKFNFEYPEGVVNAYEYNTTDEDGVSGISKRREYEKEININETSEIKYSKKALEIKKKIEYWREKIKYIHTYGKQYNPVDYDFYMRLNKPLENNNKEIVQYRVCKNNLDFNNNIFGEMFSCNNLEEARQLKTQLNQRHEKEIEEALLNAKKVLNEEDFNKQINSDEAIFDRNSKWYIERVTNTTTYEEIE